MLSYVFMALFASPHYLTQNASTLFQNNYAQDFLKVLIQHQS